MPASRRDCARVLVGRVGGEADADDEDEHVRHEEQEDAERDRARDHRSSGARVVLPRPEADVDPLRAGTSRLEPPRVASMVSVTRLCSERTHRFARLTRPSAWASSVRARPARVGVSAAAGTGCSSRSAGSTPVTVDRPGRVRRRGARRAATCSRRDGGRSRSPRSRRRSTRRRRPRSPRRRRTPSCPHRRSGC